MLSTLIDQQHLMHLGYVICRQPEVKACTALGGNDRWHDGKGNKSYVSCASRGVHCGRSEYNHMQRNVMHKLSRNTLAVQSYS